MENRRNVRETTIAPIYFLFTLYSSDFKGPSPMYWSEFMLALLVAVISSVGFHNLKLLFHRRDAASLTVVGRSPTASESTTYLL